ncbi:unnamed protein product [Withania somnifera]
MTLYFQDWSGGANATVLQIIGHQDHGPLSFAMFGSAFVTDDTITEAFNKNSEEIARTRGIYVASVLDSKIYHVLISIIFTIKEYKGSTLEIQGASPRFERVREVAVVGRTDVVIQCKVTILHY